MKDCWQYTPSRARCQIARRVQAAPPVSAGGAALPLVLLVRMRRRVLAGLPRLYRWLPTSPGGRERHSRANEHPESENQVPCVASALHKGALAQTWHATGLQALMCFWFLFYADISAGNGVKSGLGVEVCATVDVDIPIRGDGLHAFNSRLDMRMA